MAGDNPPPAILDLVHSMRDIAQRAMQQYRPLMDDILRTGSRDAQYIEHTLDGLLDFGGHAYVVPMHRQSYRQSYRHYWQIEQTATAFQLARNQHLVLRNLRAHVADLGPFVAVARVGGFEQQALRTCLQHSLQPINASTTNRNPARVESRAQL